MLLEKVELQEFIEGDMGDMLDCIEQLNKTQLSLIFSLVTLKHGSNSECLHQRTPRELCTDDFEIREDRYDLSMFEKPSVGLQPIPKQPASLVDTKGKTLLQRALTKYVRFDAAQVSQHEIS